jgi:hypothetical protein
MKRTIRCAYDAACEDCPKERCRLPVYCYADPLELTLSWLGGAETEDSQFGAALRQARSALTEGALEAAEAAIEGALERWNAIQSQAFTRTNGAPAKRCMS